MALTVDTEPLDETSSEQAYEYACTECGTELFYRGKGRRPVRCTPNNGGSDTCYKTPGVSRGPRKTSTQTVDQLVVRIQEMHRMVGSGLMFHPKTSMDGMVLVSNADTVGESWRTLLESDKKVRAMWDKFFTVSGWGAVVGTYLMMVGMPIAQNHGLFKGGVPVQTVTEPVMEQPSTSFRAPDGES